MSYYHQNPIDDYGFNKKSRVVHFPVDASMGHIYTPDASAQYPYTLGSEEDYPAQSDFPEPWKRNKWSRFPKSPNIIFPSNVWNQVARVTGAEPSNNGDWGDYTGGAFYNNEVFASNASVESWVMEIWIRPDFGRGYSSIAMWHMGSFWSGWSYNSMDHYPFNHGNDAMESYIANFYGHRLFTWIIQHGAPGNRRNLSDADNQYRSQYDYFHNYYFDASAIDVDNKWLHVVYEWHYGGSETKLQNGGDPSAASAPDNWSDYWDNYDPTCRVWINGTELPRGLKGWNEIHTGNDDYLVTSDGDEVTCEEYNLPAINYHSGNIARITPSGGSGTFDPTNQYPYGLPSSAISFLGGNALSVDRDKNNGWESTGSLWYGYNRTFNDDGSADYSSFSPRDWNFRGYMTEFRLWKNMRYSKTGFNLRNDVDTSSIPTKLDYARATGKEEGLVAYYPMNEGHGKYLYDKSRVNNYPAIIMSTPKVNTPYPGDENDVAAFNVRWSNPAGNVPLREAKDEVSVFIKQNSVLPFVEEDKVNKKYKVDEITFGESYETIVEPAITNFSFIDANGEVCAPQIGDELLVKWTVDPSCLKRDMIQTMSNVVTIAIPHYTEDLESYLEAEAGSGAQQGRSDGETPGKDYFASLLEMEVKDASDSDFTDYVYFRWDTNKGVNYSLYKGYDPVLYDSTTDSTNASTSANTKFENIFASKSVGSNQRLDDVDLNDYYFIAYVRWVTKSRINEEIFYSRNAMQYAVDMPELIPIDPSQDPSSPMSEYAESWTLTDKKITDISNRIITPTFSGTATDGDPHTITLDFSGYPGKGPMLEASNLHGVRLWVINKYPTVYNSDIVSNYTYKSAIKGATSQRRNILRRR